MELTRLEAWLAALERDGLRRRVDAGDTRARAARAAAAVGRRLLDLSSNDYLGFGAELVSRETVFSLEGVRPSASASRLLHGTYAQHRDLEALVADWLGYPEALLFSSGYALNASVIPALVGPKDAVFSDALNHASIVDGCRLSRASVHVYPHLDLARLDRLLGTTSAEQRLVVTESYFSMDGDGPDLTQLRALCDRHHAWLLVDEAHALGVFGPHGAGRCAAAEVQPEVLVGTLGKALASQGAFVAGSTVLRDWLWNRARGFVFSTGVSPVLAALGHRLVCAVRSADDRRNALQSVAGRFRHLLADRTIPCLSDFGPIVPLLVPSPHAALNAATALVDRGILVQAVRPPTVPAGTSRLRLTLHATLTDDDLAYLADSLKAVLES